MKPTMLNIKDLLKLCKNKSFPETLEASVISVVKENSGDIIPYPTSFERAGMDSETSKIYNHLDYSILSKSKEIKNNFFFSEDGYIDRQLNWYRLMDKNQSNYFDQLPVKLSILEEINKEKRIKHEKQQIEKRRILLLKQKQDLLEQKHDKEKILVNNEDWWVNILIENKNYTIKINELNNVFIFGYDLSFLSSFYKYLRIIAPISRHMLSENGYPISKTFYAIAPMELKTFTVEGKETLCFLMHEDFIYENNRVRHTINPFKNSDFLYELFENDLKYFDSTFIKTLKDEYFKYKKKLSDFKRLKNNILDISGGERDLARKRELEKRKKIKSFNIDYAQIEKQKELINTEIKKIVLKENDINYNIELHNGLLILLQDKNVERKAIESKLKELSNNLAATKSLLNIKNFGLEKIKLSLNEIKVKIDSLNKS